MDSLTNRPQLYVFQYQAEVFVKIWDQDEGAISRSIHSVAKTIKLDKIMIESHLNQLLSFFCLYRNFPEQLDTIHCVFLFKEVLLIVSRY